MVYPGSAGLGLRQWTESFETYIYPWSDLGLLGSIAQSVACLTALIQRSQVRIPDRPHNFCTDGHSSPSNDSRNDSSQLLVNVCAQVLVITTSGTKPAQQKFEKVNWTIWHVCNSIDWAIKLQLKQTNKDSNRFKHYLAKLLRIINGCFNIMRKFNDFSKIYHVLDLILNQRADSCQTCTVTWDDSGGY